MNTWATIILWDGAEASTDRIVRESATEKLTIVFAQDAQSAAQAAEELVAEGAELIELCGGFGLPGGAEVLQRIQGRAAVGAVLFGIDSITEAARYKARFEAVTADARAS